MRYDAHSICPLPDVHAARIDPKLPSQEHTRLFRLRRSGGSPAEILFNESAAELQHRFSERGQMIQ